jgi:hypothetical protein
MAWILLGTPCAHPRFCGYDSFADLSRQMVAGARRVASHDESLNSVAAFAQGFCMGS